MSEKKHERETITGEVNRIASDQEQCRLPVGVLVNNGAPGGNNESWDPLRVINHNARGDSRSWFREEIRASESD